MNLRFFTKLVFAALLIGFVASCMKDDSEPYVPPTHEEEMALLDQYIDTLENRGYDVDTTEMGVYYVVDSVGTGDFPVDGDTCVVKYTGFFIGGTIFDASGDNTFEVVLGDGDVIDGWEDGLKVFNKGSEGYLIIPSEYAYGSKGSYDYYGYLKIPPYTTVLFHVEMVDIKQGY
uniref:FKBP-type peptidyl-prolyl cis-trans isomerase n=1 Tax=uncultured Draconibacterium sp. TaxID=1573823 RepID=UPI003216B422